MDGIEKKEERRKKTDMMKTDMMKKATKVGRYLRGRRSWQIFDEKGYKGWQIFEKGLGHGHEGD